MLTNFDFFKQIVLNEAVAEGIDEKAYGKIRQSYMQIVTNLPFFAELLFNLAIYEASSESGVDTMATDGRSIFYNAEFTNGLKSGEVTFIIIHEIMHNANFHFARQGGRDHELWNYAADYAINIPISDLAKGSRGTSIMSTPTDICLDEKYRGMSAEMIYDILEKNPPPKKGGGGQGKPGQGQGQGKPGQGQGKPGQGQGQGPGQGSGPGRTAPKGGGEPQGDVRAPGSLKPQNGKQVYSGGKHVAEAANSTQLEEEWRRIRNDAATKNQGTGSDAFDRWVKSLNNPKVNWRNELRSFVGTILNDWDFAMGNRRFIHAGKYYPGLKEADPDGFEDVVIAIDTSGSISDETLGEFGTEMVALFSEYAIMAHVIWCDASIPNGGVQDFDLQDNKFELKKLKPVGGGGTSFHPPFMWIQTNLLERGKSPAFVIYFTDADGSCPSSMQYGINRYQNKVMWVVTDKDDAPNINFGKCIFIDKNPVD